MTEPEPPQIHPQGVPGQRPSSPLFEFNRPTVVALLYLRTPLLLLSAVVGVALAYSWRSDLREGEAWEWAHYTYHIRTFWLAIAAIAGTVALALAILFVTDGWGQRDPIPALMVPAAGVFLIPLLLAVRCIFALLRAQKRAPMPRPRSWLV